MRRAAVLLSMLLATGFQPAHSELFLISGSPTPKYVSSYPTALLKLAAGGKVVQVASVAQGTEWIGVSYDWDKAVILPRYPANDISVIDFESGAVSKKCADPPAPIGGLVDQWFVDSVAFGPLFVEYLVGNDLNKGRLRGMILDRAIPCESSFVNVDPSEARFFMSSGAAGVSDVGGVSAMHVAIAKDGVLSLRLGSTVSYFDLQVPPQMLDGIAIPNAFVLVSNQRAVVVGISDAEKADNQRLLLFRRSDNTWRRIPIAGQHISWTRAFGNFIAMAEAWTKNAEHPVSAGKSEWRKADTVKAPQMAARFQNYGVTYPGRLRLYDVDTGAMYLIATDQGDSEVLLVDGSAVYYRVSDRLYQASIAGGKVSPGRLIATSDELLSVHWAFFKH